MKNYTWATPYWNGEEYPANYNVITLFNLFTALEIPFSFKKLSEEINVEFTLDDFSSYLSSWNFPNEAVMVGKDLITELPVPTVLYLNGEGIFVILENLTGNTANIVHPGKGIITYSVEELKNLWEGECIILEKESNSGDPEIEKSLDIENSEREYFLEEFKIVDNFIDEETCKIIIEAMADPQPSVLVQDREFLKVDKDYRDSIEYFTRDQNVIDILYDKTSKFFNDYPKDQLEPIQYVGYVPGQRFKPHYDVGLSEPIVRSHTILIYLNEEFEGGETVFPYIDIKVTPKTGRAIVFPNLNIKEGKEKEIALFSYHGALPIQKGKKFISLFCITDTPRSHENWNKFYKPVEEYQQLEKA